MVSEWAEAVRLSASRSNYRNKLALEWIKEHRLDVWQALIEIALEKYPKPPEKKQGRCRLLEPDEVDKIRKLK